jgi:CTP synthase
MRLGLYPCNIFEGSVAERAYDKALVQERHRHRFEFNNTYREIFNQHGMEFSGQSPNGRLVEIAEFREHPFMLGSQFHPEFLSRPNRPHPLFRLFVETIRDRAHQHEQEPQAHAERAIKEAEE